MSLTIRSRLILLAMVVVTSVAFLMYTAWTSFEHSKVFSPMYDEFIEQKDLLADVLPPPAYALEIFAEAHRYTDVIESERKKVREQIDALEKSFVDRWEYWIAKEGHLEHRKPMIAVRDSGKAVIEAVDACHDLVDSKADADSIHKAMKNIDDLYFEHRNKIDEVVKHTTEELASREQEARHVEQKEKRDLVIAGIVSMLLVVVGSWLIGRSIIRPINRAVGQLGSGSEQVSSAATQVSAGAQRIAQGASEQAASLEETTASLEELSATCRQNADNARQANALAGEASHTSESGEAAARKAAAEVAAQLKELATAIEAIRLSTDKTTAVVESIDDIAIQINLLALNAAVEAARAGEAGMGFAVVADEVRNLAARSTEEAKNTSALIKESRANAERVHAVAKAVQEHLAQSLDRETVGNFQQVVAKVRKMSQLIAEVAAASDEQAKGVEQINAAVAQMDKVTQENAASAEQSAASSEEMQAQATGLQGTVGDLRRLVEGGSGQQADGGFPAPVAAPHSAPARITATQAPVRRTASMVSTNGHGKSNRPSQVLPLTDAEAADHQGDFSRF